MAKAKHRHDVSGTSEFNTSKLQSKNPAHAFDPAVASLFQDSIFKFGPVKPSAKPSLPTASLVPKNNANNPHEISAEASEITERTRLRTSVGDLHQSSSNVEASQLSNNDQARSTRKRKRPDTDDLEGRYLQQLAREEAKEQSHLQSRRQRERRQLEVTKRIPSDDSLSGSDKASKNEDGDTDVSEDEPLQHESLDASKEEKDFEKSSRTVFLANVSTSAIKSKSSKKALLEHLVSFAPSLPDSTGKIEIESFRFRSTAFANAAVPRKAAFAKKELMDATTQSTNAYAVYNTALAAREASKNLNGSMILGRHLRVDLVAHPAKTDHRRCVFVGNLGFVDDMTKINLAEGNEDQESLKKAKEPADVEEGLWRQFSKAGAVESVRVIRDKTTRVGKGFAYVQFEEPNSVEKALLYNEKKFPPMLPRILRVTRAKNIKKASSQKDEKVQLKSAPNSSTMHKPKVPGRVQSLSGRAPKLLGRAGAANLKAAGKFSGHSLKVSSVGKSPEAIVFEGYRASRQQGKGTLKLGGSGKSKGKPRTRSSRRGAEFKARGRKKGKT
ncbi:Nucleolar protein 12 [Lecanora helva]